MSKKKVDRKVVHSFTIDKKLLEESRKCCKQISLSKYICLALEEYNKEQKKDGNNMHPEYGGVRYL